MSYAAHDLTWRANGRVLLDGVSLELRSSQVHALLGPNGAGKSTLLKLLAGELKAQSGSISINSRTLATLGARELAAQRAVLPQVHGLSFAFTAAQVVSLGRIPAARHAPEREAQIVREALELAGVADLATRSYPTLSGGERARVQFARVVAQVWDAPADGAARYLLLDEPTANLDLAHQHDCLRAVRALALRGLGVLVIVHDPNLALRYASQVTLMREGRVLGSGPPGQVITAAALEALYQVPVRLVQAEGERLPVVVVREK